MPDVPIHVRGTVQHTRLTTDIRYTGRHFIPDELVRGRVVVVETIAEREHSLYSAMSTSKYKMGSMALNGLALGTLLDKENAPE